MNPTYAVGGLTAADIDLIVLALDRYTSDDSTIPSDYAERLLLKFDDITDPVEDEFLKETDLTTTVKQGTVIHVNFKR